jgi:hypothetical protein
MLDVSELTEDQAGLVRRLIETYPGGLAYRKGREVHALAAPLVEAGYLTRMTETDLPGLGEEIAYKLSEDYAEQVRGTAKEKGEAAQWN